MVGFREGRVNAGIGIGIGRMLVHSPCLKYLLSVYTPF